MTANTSVNQKVCLFFFPDDRQLKIKIHHNAPQASLP